MSDAPIKHDQIIEPKVFDPASQSADVLLEKMTALIAAFKQLILITGKKVPLTDPKTLSEAEQLAAALKKITDLENGLTTAQKAQVQAQQILNKQKAEYRTQLKAEESAYQALSSKLNEQKKAVKDLLASRKELSSSDKELIKNTKDLDQQLKDIDSTVGDNGRSVGAYKEALNDVTAEMGSFGGMITRIARTLKTLQEQQEHSSTTMQKMGNVLKAVGIGIALALIAAIVEANAAANKMSESLERMSEKFDINNSITERGREIMLAYAKSMGKEGVARNLGEAREALSALVDITIVFNNLMRSFQIELKELTVKQDEFNQVANDTTIGYNERIAAQKESIAISIEIAKKNEQIARAGFNQAQLEVATAEKVVGLGNATKEQKDKLLEATLALSEAEAASELLSKENATKRRQLAQEETDQLIDLTLKSKQSAHARKQILEDELKDHKIQLEERKKIAADLFTTNTKSVDEELRIFKHGRQVQFDANKLLHEQNEVLLADKIKAIKTDEGHGLDAAGVVELAKIIKQSQENEIANEKQKKDLQEEEVKRLQKIAQIESEISILNSAEDAKVAKEAYETLNKKIEENYKKLVDSPFSAKLQKQRNIELAQRKQDVQDVFDTEAHLLEAQADLEVQNAKDSIQDEKVRAEEIKKIRAKLQIDLANIQGDYLKDVTKNNDEEKKQNEKLYREKLAMAVKSVGDITDGIKDGLAKRSEMQQLADQKDIDMRQRMIDVQRGLAEQGKDNVLGETLAQQAKAEEKKLQDAKKAAKQQETLAEIQTFEKVLEAALKSDKPFQQALAEAIASEGIVSAVFSKMFAGFYEGTEDTGTVSNPLDAHGGRLAIHHDNERIVPKRLNDMLGGMSNEELVQAAIAPPRIAESSVSVAEFNNRQVAEMTKEIKALREDMAAKPTPSFALGNKMGEYNEQWNTKLRTTLIHHKRSDKRPSLRLNG